MQSLSCPLAFPQHWWATTARKLQPLSPISSHAPSKCKSNVKNGFDVATCSRTTTGTDGQLTLTVINPSQCYCLILIGEATFPVLLIPCYSLNNPVHIYTHTHIYVAESGGQQSDRTESAKQFLPRSLITCSFHPYSGAEAHGLMNVT